MSFQGTTRTDPYGRSTHTVLISDESRPSVELVRTPPNRGTRAVPLCVGCMSDEKVFSLIRSLPSSLSAGSCLLVRGVHRCRVGGGALARWPPSAAQTVRAVFPHTAFTKTHVSGMQSKESIEPGSPAHTRRTAWFSAAVSSHHYATV